jgi:hypothetical protein
MTADKKYVRVLEYLNLRVGELQEEKAKLGPFTQFNADEHSRVECRINELKRLWDIAN